MAERVPSYTEKLENRLEEANQKCTEAQEAAETYWEAWQDAAVYWKGQLREARRTARQLRIIALTRTHEDQQAEVRTLTRSHSWLREPQHTDD